jgi:hypothetical protein
LATGGTIARDNAGVHREAAAMEPVVGDRRDSSAN